MNYKYDECKTCQVYLSACPAAYICLTAVLTVYLLVCLHCFLVQYWSTCFSANWSTCLTDLLPALFIYVSTCFAACQLTWLFFLATSTVYMPSYMHMCLITCLSGRLSFYLHYTDYLLFWQSCLFH